MDRKTFRPIAQLIVRIYRLIQNDRLLQRLTVKKNNLILYALGFAANDITIKIRHIEG